MFCSNKVAALFAQFDAIMHVCPHPELRINSIPSVAAMIAAPTMGRARDGVIPRIKPDPPAAILAAEVAPRVATVAVLAIDPTD